MPTHEVIARSFVFNLRGAGIRKLFQDECVNRLVMREYPLAEIQRCSGLAPVVSNKYLLNNILLKLYSLCCCSSTFGQRRAVKYLDGSEASGEAAPQERGDAVLLSSSCWRAVNTAAPPTGFVSQSRSDLEEAATELSLCYRWRNRGTAERWRVLRSVCSGNGARLELRPARLRLHPVHFAMNGDLSEHICSAVSGKSVSTILI